MDLLGQEKRIILFHSLFDALGFWQELWQMRRRLHSCVSLVLSSFKSIWETVRNLFESSFELQRKINLPLSLLMKLMPLAPRGIQCESA